jgi:anti-sigma factor ChrR (cupin superfamily)
MATLTICDRCKKDGRQVAAHFHVTFERIPAAGGAADHPMDLCKGHYEQLWAGL